MTSHDLRLSNGSIDTYKHSKASWKNVVEVCFKNNFIQSKTKRKKTTFVTSTLRQQRMFFNYAKLLLKIMASRGEKNDLRLHGRNQAACWVLRILSLSWSINHWGLVCQKKVSRAWTSNYIPQYLWDVITSPCPWYLLLCNRWVEIAFTLSTKIGTIHDYSTCQEICTLLHFVVVW